MSLRGILFTFQKWYRSWICTSTFTSLFLFYRSICTSTRVKDVCSYATSAWNRVVISLIRSHVSQSCLWTAEPFKDAPFTPGHDTITTSPVFRCSCHNLFQMCCCHQVQNKHIFLKNEWCLLGKTLNLLSLYHFSLIYVKKDLEIWGSCTELSPFVSIPMATRLCDHDLNQSLCPRWYAGRSDNRQK